MISKASGNVKDLLKLLFLTLGVTDIFKWNQEKYQDKSMLVKPRFLEISKITKTKWKHVKNKMSYGNEP